jgi:hypothetical protein
LNTNRSLQAFPFIWLTQKTHLALAINAGIAKKPTVLAEVNLFVRIAICISTPITTPR